MIQLSPNISIPSTKLKLFVDNTKYIIGIVKNISVLIIRTTQFDITFSCNIFTYTLLILLSKQVKCYDSYHVGLYLL